MNKLSFVLLSSTWHPNFLQSHTLERINLYVEGKGLAYQTSKALAFLPKEYPVPHNTTRYAFACLALQLQLQRSDQLQRYNNQKYLYTQDMQRVQYMDDANGTYILFSLCWATSSVRGQLKSTDSDAKHCCGAVLKQRGGGQHPICGPIRPPCACITCTQ